MLGTMTTNPYADRWDSMSYDSDDGAMMRHESEEAQAYPTRTDAKGTDYFYRPGVGGWWSASGQLWKATRR